MRHFTSIKQLGSLHDAMEAARYVKEHPFADQELGRNKTLLMVFFNNSLRTRLSTQKAALNLGMNVIVLDVNQGAWKLETERGVVMDGDKSEHLLEAIPVMGCYCDIIGVRSFAGLEDRERDYGEEVLNQFIRYSGKPVFSMEAATRHPLQTYADIITIEEHKTKARPKVVADFVYAKNWSVPDGPGYGKVLCGDRGWTVTSEKMALTNDAFFMHCLPVRRNMIVSDDVIEGPRSLVIPEAANRVVSAQAVLKQILKTI